MCVRCDEYGFFIYWKSEGREGDVKELSQVNDIRDGELPKVKLRDRDIKDLRESYKSSLRTHGLTALSQRDTGRISRRGASSYAG